MESNRKRSQRSLAELRGFLQGLAEEAGLSSLILATEDGLMLAAAGSGRDHETLAAISPLLLASGIGAGTDDVLEDLSRMGLTVRVRNFQYGDQFLYVCAVGKPESTAGPRVGKVLSGVKSYLTTA